MEELELVKKGPQEFRQKNKTSCLDWRRSSVTGDLPGFDSRRRKDTQRTSLLREIYQVSMVAHNFIPVLERPRQTDFCEALVSVHNGFQAYRSI